MRKVAVWSKDCRSHLRSEAEGRHVARLRYWRSLRVSFERSLFELDDDGSTEWLEWLDAWGTKLLVRGAAPMGRCRPGGATQSFTGQAAHGLFILAHAAYDLLENDCGISLDDAGLNRAVCEMTWWRDEFARMVTQDHCFAEQAASSIVQGGLRDRDYSLGSAALAFGQALGVTDERWRVEAQRLKAAIPDARLFLCRMYCVASLVSIDDAILMLQRGNAQGAVRLAMEATENYNSACMALRPYENRMVTLREVATAGGKARHRDSLKDKLFVYDCWQDWRSGKRRYPSGAEFSRDMHSKCEHIKSVGTIETWIAGWAKGRGIPEA